MYALLEGSGAVEFSATPMILGVTAIVAGLARTGWSPRNHCSGRQGF